MIIASFIHLSRRKIDLRNAHFGGGGIVRHRDTNEPLPDHAFVEIELRS